MANVLWCKWVCIHPSMYNGDRRKKLENAKTTARPSHLTVSQDSSQTMGHEVTAKIPTDSITFMEYYATGSTNPRRLDFLCVGSDLPFDAPLYSQVSQVHFKGNILSWKMVFKIIAKLPNCHTVVFKWTEQEALALHGQVVDFLDREFGAVDRVKTLSLNLTYPSDDHKLWSALRAQLAIVVTQCQRLYPNVDKLCLDLPDDGRIYDLMKALVPKWKGLEGTTLGIKEGKIVVEKKCVAGSSSGSNSKGRSRTVTKRTSTSSSVAADVTSSPVLTMQEKEKPTRPPENPKAKVEATEMLVDGGNTVTTSQATNNNPVIPSHPEMTKEEPQPLQVPRVARNSTGESDELNENPTFSTQFTRRNLTEEEIYMQNEMMNNRSSREGVPTIERNNLSYTSNEWVGPDNFPEGSYNTPVVWDQPSSSFYHPEFSQSPYPHTNWRRDEYHMSGPNDGGRGWNGGPRRRPRRERGGGHSRHFIPLGKLPERMP